MAVTSPQPQQQLSHPGEKHSPDTTQHSPADPGRRVGSGAGAVPEGVAVEMEKAQQGPPQDLGPAPGDTGPAPGGTGPAPGDTGPAHGSSGCLGGLSQLSSAGGEAPPAKGLLGTPAVLITRPLRC